MKEERVSRNHKERNSISWETCHKLGQKKGEQKKERKLLQFRPDGNFWYEGFYLMHPRIEAIPHE